MFGGDATRCGEADGCEANDAPGYGKGERDEMAECPLLTQCPFFNDRLAHIPGRMAAVYSKRYCTGDSSQCAIYMVFMVMGMGKVPEDLFPSQTKRAQRIISGS